MDFVKVTFNLLRSEIDWLTEAARGRGISVTQCLRQCVTTEKFLSEQVAAGRRLLVESPDGTFQEMLLRHTLSKGGES